ncbi:FCD domain-containing protein [Arthrobacter sp. SD76]|uniref:FCD domain-containing protein n=1 Tax=Arthrobacter sp. SD76 TaxID=3415007 RepID=UPI003C7380CC
MTRSQWLRSEAFVSANRAQHHAIVEALASHNAEAAATVLRDHLRVSSPEFSTFPR